MSGSGSLWDLSLSAALEQTASGSPTPGGGSIAPMSAAFGLGLVIMALEVSGNKQPSAALTEALAQGRSQLAELAAFVDRDVAVFQGYMDALRLPKGTQAEQAARDSARAAASMEAARTPLKAAEACLRALVFAHSSAAYVSKNVWSDLLAGADLLIGALKAVLRTVDINLPMLKDAASRQAIAERAAHLEHEAMQTYFRIVAAETSA
jgi:methenyltetrahydrofolate cyclohydrolase